MNENDHIRDLLVRGVAAAKAKETNEARFYLKWLLEMQPAPDLRVEALIWLAELSADANDKRKWIEEALAYNPADMRSRRILAILNGLLLPEQIMDPDQIQHPYAAPEPQKASADRFVCPQCGGRMTFTPDGKDLSCEYCEARGSNLRLQTTQQAVAAENFLIAMATGKGHLHPVNRQSFICQGCAAEFILAAEEISSTCPYCASVYVIKNSTVREQISPHLIFPFEINATEAHAALQHWLKLARLTQNGNLVIERGSGIYLPAWSFEMAGQVPWTGMVEESRNRWVAQAGNEIVYHTSVLVPAGNRLCSDCTDELHCFNLQQAVTYEESYLANWPAETYTVTLGDASLEARRWTYEFEKQSVRDRFLQPVRDLGFHSTGITIESFRLVLLPLWLFYYQVDKERFQVVINGVAVCPAVSGL